MSTPAGTPTTPEASQTLPPRSRLQHGALRAMSFGDFILRLAFFLVAPFVLLGVAILMPIIGILINLALAIAVYFLAHRVRKVPLVAKLLGRSLAFEAYYREHPPKPFLYYVFFPLLFPYWLAKRDARREVFAYRGFTGMSLLLLVGISAAKYFLQWRPEIPFRLFAAFAVASVVFQLLVAMLFLMPLATSVIAYHARGYRYRLAALVTAFGLSAGMMIHWHLTNPRPVHPLEVELRARWRTKYASTKAQEVLLDAARAASIDLVDDGAFPDVLRDRQIEDVSLDTAKDQLATLYKSDECDDFSLTIIQTKRGKTALLLFQAREFAAPPKLWVAVDGSGRKLDVDQIADTELADAARGRRAPKPKPKPAKKPAK